MLYRVRTPDEKYIEVNYYARSSGGAGDVMLKLWSFKDDKESVIWMSKENFLEIAEWIKNSKDE